MFWYWIWDSFTTGEEEDKNQNISEYCNWLLTVNRQWDMWFKIYIHKNNLILNGFNYSYLNHIRLKKFRGNIVIFISNCMIVRLKKSMYQITKKLLACAQWEDDLIRLGPVQAFNQILCDSDFKYCNCIVVQISN